MVPSRSRPFHATPVQHPDRHNVRSLFARTLRIHVCPDRHPQVGQKCDNRKYLDAAERRRFLESAQQLPTPERLFYQVLAWSGARISEVLALAPAAIDIESGVASIQTLKRRRRGIVRQVPLPMDVLNELQRLLPDGTLKIVATGEKEDQAA